MPKQFMLGLLVSSAVLLSVVAAPAGNINDALSKAYQKNSELNSIRADVRVTAENIAKAKSGFRPTITGSAGLSYTTKRSNFSNRLTTGSFGVQIDQTLFDGFQTKNNVAAAEARSAASVEQLRSSVEQTLFSAAQAYMNVLHDRRAAVLTRQNLAFANEWVRSAKARMDVGEGTGTDVAQTEAFRANAVAAVSLADSQVKTSEAIYRRIVGDNAGKLEPGQPLSRLLPRNLNSAFVIANKEHPAILASAHLVDAAGHTVKSSEGALLPQETAEAGISERGNPTSGSGGSVGSGPYGFGTSAKVGLNVRVPIYQAGKAAAQVRQSKESLSQSRIEVDVSRNEVRKAVADAWSAYESSRSNVRANKDNVSYTELALNGIVDERSVGQRTTLNVLEAQQDVINAKLNLIASERDLVLSTYAILQATGLLSPDRLGLDVAKYNHEEHYNAVKDKWIGIRTPDGR
ncbi:TolC family outer membrane protein [Sinorhizobium psoraleae]|uniref:TolC family outer membrane protein n=1 Tax=Sinorhizobium psoraleae TaxID=520838 RepID=A0ABT4KN35_9HYPH|nr:TolC family outer membrane protein [Sinorhizobium psoraleae]MCZ4093366.1 TolC family outer membrane protein [Sinorhizobium psoraleae]